MKESKKFVRITIQQHRPSKQTYQSSLMSFNKTTTIENLINKLIESKKLKISKQTMKVLYDDQDMPLDTIISQLENDDTTKIVLRIVYTDIEQSEYISGIAPKKQSKQPSKSLDNIPEIKKGVSQIILTKDNQKVFVKKLTQPKQKLQTLIVSVNLVDGHKQFHQTFQCKDTDCYADIQQKLTNLFFENWQYYEPNHERARIFINNQPLIKKNKAFRLMGNTIIDGKIYIKIQRLFAGG